MKEMLTFLLVIKLDKMDRQYCSELMHFLTRRFHRKLQVLMTVDHLVSQDEVNNIPLKVVDVCYLDPIPIEIY